MKILSSYTVEEKVKIFDKLYQECLVELHNTNHNYFYEGITGDILGLNQKDWITMPTDTPMPNQLPLYKIFVHNT